MTVSLKQKLVAAARAARVVPLFEAARFLRAAAAASTDNRAYIRDHPDFVAPPLWWMHDMYSHASYRQYAETGAATAGALAEIARRCGLVAAPRVADWGCGLARVIRRLPKDWRATGFDDNAAAIDWCAKTAPGADFRRNALTPPLPAEPSSFDMLYALSVFTHLSEAGHVAWVAEIERVLAPGGLFLVALHMKPYPGQLLEDERRRFDAGALVTRAGVREGGRTYTAFHPERYVRDVLLARFEIVEGPLDFFGQSLTVARKKAAA
ncbi:MAG: class I SAM-dependent methyltransferase [Parvularculaceae bacterium]|nr:class I SAM-dependent methyltransferase [Parvularculaceae bacterium]